MEQEPKLVKLETPKTPEQPEEGFVPYVTEANPAQNRRLRGGVIVLIVLTLLTVCLFLFMMIGKSHNFYTRTLESLRFDYRSGETVTEEHAAEKGQYSLTLAEQLSGKDYSFEAVSYSCNESGTADNIVTAYNYHHTAMTDTVKSCSGVAGTPAKHKQTEEIAMGLATTTASSPSLLMKEFFFGVSDHDVFKFENYDAYLSKVGNTSYRCEIWLLSDNRSPASPVHYTLYRYYLGSQLAGVRVLNNRNTRIDVYDIKQYTIE